MQACLSRRTDLAFGVILAACALYLTGLIWRTCFVVDGVRYFCLFDDAMVSMRFARNLAEGYGAVWNPGGERVEGYTNPLWMVSMSILHLLPVPAAKMSLLVQVSSAWLLLANLFFVRRIGESVSGGDPFVSLGAVLLTAFYLPLNNWAIQGMEVGLAACLLSCAVAKALQAVSVRRFSSAVYWCLGLGLLVRMDMAVPLLIVWLFLLLSDRANRRRHWLAGVTTLAVGLGGPAIVRLFYYGDPLPNTYYLKMTGYPLLLRIARGAVVLWDFVWNTNLAFFLLPWFVTLARRDKHIAFLLAVVFGQLAYSVYVGGDAWEWWGGANRYIAIVMPLYFVSFCWGMGEIAKRLISVPGQPPALRKSWPVALAVLLGLGAFNARNATTAALLEPPIHVRDNERMVKLALLLREATRPQARVAVVWAGIIPYFADRQMIDLMGKCDRHVARRKAHRPSAGWGLRYFYPGHVKWDYEYSLGDQQPDIVLQAWDLSSPSYLDIEAARAYLGAEYQQLVVRGSKFFVRRSSPNVDWNRIEELQRPLSPPKNAV